MERRILFRGEFLNFIREGHWEYVDRTRATGAAIIVALTPSEEILTVEQYRIPLHARTLELPAGIIGDEAEHSGETHEAAARRELLEETGWTAGTVEVIAKGAASSGVTSEIVTIFLASNLERSHKGGGIGSEDITVHQVALRAVDAWLERKAAEGLLIDPKIYAGLYFLKRLL